MSSTFLKTLEDILNIMYYFYYKFILFDYYVFLIMNKNI